MLVIGRALMTQPKLMMIDEPSLGLAPRAIANLFAVLAALREEGRTLLLVEQLAGLALALADRAYVLETGRIVHSGQAEEVARNATLETVYLGTKPANRFP